MIMGGGEVISCPGKGNRGKEKGAGLYRESEMKRTARGNTGLNAQRRAQPV